MFKKAKPITRENKLTILMATSAQAVSVFKDAITTLEDTNKEYLRIRDEISEETAKLLNAHSDISDKMKSNEKLLDNFKSFLQ